LKGTTTVKQTGNGSKKADIQNHHATMKLLALLRQFLCILDAQCLKKVNPLLDWAGSEGTAGWFAIFMHFRKL
jgi:hypothetical protein